MEPVDFDVFVSTWNEHQGQTTPELHAEIARWLAERWRAGDRALLLLAFRNAGKSTQVGLFCAWLLARDPDVRIVVLAADFALARKMVRNVKRIIERHPLTLGMKPDRADQWASDQFTVNRRRELRDPSMLAKGIGANVTGSRADVVICDDVEVPNTADTAPKRADLRERLEEIDFVLVPGGTTLYVGTPHTYYSIYADASRPETGETEPYLAGFTRLTLPLLDDKGHARWPERFTAERIEAIRRRGHNKFKSQMLLEPVNIAEGRLDPDRLRLYDDDLVYREGNDEARLLLGSRRLVSASCWWDPSFGAPDKGDASVIAALYTDEEGDYRLHAVRYLAHDPALAEAGVDEATQLCRQVAAFVRDNYLPAVTLETNGLGRFLPGLLRREIATAGLRCAVVETASRRAKDLRILDAFDVVLAAERLHAHRDVWRTPFVTEMREWRPGAGARDDGLDAVAGCLLSEPVRLPRLPAPAANTIKGRQNWRPGVQGFKAKTEFGV